MTVLIEGITPGVEITIKADEAGKAVTFTGGGEGYSVFLPGGSGMCMSMKQEFPWRKHTVFPGGVVEMMGLILGPAVAFLARKLEAEG